MPTQKHIHKLKRHTYKTTGNTMYFCVLPDCTFKIETAFSFGKQSICWRCGKPFEMTSYAMTLAKPHCMSCHKSTKGNYVPSTIVDSLLPDDMEKRSADRRQIPDRREHISTIEEMQDKLNPVTYKTIEDPEL